jgi:hypothetical protein
MVYWNISAILVAIIKISKEKTNIINSNTINYSLIKAEWLMYIYTYNQLKC